MKEEPIEPLDDPIETSSVKNDSHRMGKSPKECDKCLQMFNNNDLLMSMLSFYITDLFSFIIISVHRVLWHKLPFCGICDVVFDEEDDLKEHNSLVHNSIRLVN